MFSKFFFVFLFIFFLFIGCVADNQNFKNINNVAEWGDRVYIDYIIEIGNPECIPNCFVVFDTTLEEIAIKNNIFDTDKKYLPVEVKLAYPNNFHPAITRAINRMQLGENKTFILSPEEAFGKYDETKLFSIETLKEIPKIEKIDKFYFDIYIKRSKLKENETLDSKIGKIRIINFTEEYVVVENIPLRNYTVELNGLPYIFYDETNETFIFKLNATENKTYSVVVNNKIKKAKLKHLNSEFAIFDSNHELAGKAIRVTLYLRKVIKKGEQDGK